MKGVGYYVTCEHIVHAGNIWSCFGLCNVCAYIADGGIAARTMRTQVSYEETGFYVMCACR